MSPSLRGRGLKSLLGLSRLANVTVALFARAWIEIDKHNRHTRNGFVALFARAWIEIHTPTYDRCTRRKSPSLRGRGLKSTVKVGDTIKINVALFARAWIEMLLLNPIYPATSVALFARAWIEISDSQ